MSRPNFFAFSVFRLTGRLKRGFVTIVISKIFCERRAFVFCAACYFCIPATLDFIRREARNLTTRRAEIGCCSPVLGFLPIRGSLDATVKVANEDNFTSPSSTRPIIIHSSTSSTSFKLSSFRTSQFRRNAAAKSKRVSVFSAICLPYFGLELICALN